MVRRCNLKFSFRKILLAARIGPLIVAQGPAEHSQCRRRWVDLFAAPASCTFGGKYTTSKFRDMSSTSYSKSDHPASPCLQGPSLALIPPVPKHVRKVAEMVLRRASGCPGVPECSDKYQTRDPDAMASALLKYFVRR